MRKHHVLERKKDYIGKTVKTLVTLINGYVEIPRGTICEVTSVYGGATLKAERCSCCKMRAIVSRVPYFKIKIVDNIPKPTLIEKRLRSI